MNPTDMIRAYTAGEKTLEETNAALKEVRAGFYLDPERNVIRPGEEGRFGLLDTGTGSLDKVEVLNGELVNADLGEMVGFCHFGGKVYAVKGNQLEEI